MDQLPEKMDAVQIAAIDNRIKILQKTRGYQGDFMKWVENHLPERLEEQLGLEH